MIKVKPKIISDSKNSNDTPISTAVKILFVLIQAVLSLDFGFVKYKSRCHRLFIKFCSALLSIFLGIYNFIIISNRVSIMFEIWCTKYTVETLSYVFILLFVPEDKTFHKFLERLHIIDIQMNADNTPFKFNTQLLVTCTVSFVYKALLTIIFCTHYGECLDNILFQVFYTLQALSLDIPLIVLHSVFYATYIRLLSLKKFLKHKNTKAAQVQYLYKSLIDLTENIKQTFDPIFIVTLLINVPSLMVIIYQLIKEIIEASSDTFRYGIEIITAFALVVVIFAPAVVATFLLSETQKIRLILHDMLLEEKDPNEKHDIQRLLNYIEARPFKFSVLRVIRLDATLPVVLLNLCITYLIVILQLTHLY